MASSECLIANYKIPIKNVCMIIGTGVDIAEVARIRESIERFGDRFLHRIFTDGEIRYCERKARRFESYAARTGEGRFSNLAISAAVICPRKSFTCFLHVSRSSSFETWICLVSTGDTICIRFG